MSFGKNNFKPLNETGTPLLKLSGETSKSNNYLIK